MKLVLSHCRIFLMALLLGVMTSQASQAEDVLQSPADFVAQAFDGEAPAPQVMWLTKDVQQDIEKIMGRELSMLRLRYWGQGNQTVWILEEIGKLRPITTGIIVQGHEIKRLKVLIYRESHGWEVQHDFFTDQFVGQRLTDGQQLSQKVDGISGATLSVNALKRLGRLALYLHGQTPYGREED